jgi:hypothetical protein
VFEQPSARVAVLTARREDGDKGGRRRSVEPEVKCGYNVRGIHHRMRQGTLTIAKFSVTGRLTSTLEFNKNSSERHSHIFNLGTTEIVT